MRHITIFLAGLVFSGGLIVSGMINPEKVLGFLDIFGDWDPSLAFVMAGAVLVNIVGYRLARQRTAPLFETGFSIPATSTTDRPLIVGAILFGLGWGLAGLCPGPAIAALPAAPEQTLIFVATMLAGMMIGRSDIPDRLLSIGQKKSA